MTSVVGLKADESKQTGGASSRSPASQQNSNSRRSPTGIPLFGRASVESRERPASQAPPIVQQVLESQGQSLDPATRAFMEPRLGRDFGQVQIHRDAQAAASARAIDARAYTLGPHVVFGAGQFAPDTLAGQRLLAHELTHVVQQSGTGLGSDPFTLSPPAGRAEIEAEEIAKTIAPPDHRASTSTRRVRISPGSPSLIQRQLFTPLGPGGGFQGLMERDRARTHEVRLFDSAPPVPAAIQDGWRRIADLDAADMASANVAQRIEMLIMLVGAWWTGNDEEDAIIRVIATTPNEQAQAMVRALTEHMVEGRLLGEELDRVVDGAENFQLHTEISELRLKAMGPERGTAALTTAPVLPWHDVMGFFEEPATFSVSRRANGKVLIDYHQSVLLSKDSDYAAEVAKLPFDLFINGFEYDANQLLVIHDYDTGRFVPVVAQDLVGYQNQSIRTFLGHVATIASFAVPVSAAETALGKDAVFVLERALPTAFLIIDENRLNLVKWFPTWGPRMIYFSDLAKIGVGVYGIARFAISGAALLKAWKQTRQSRSLLEAGSIDPEAQAVASALEQQADEIFAAADDLQASERAVGQGSTAVNAPAAPVDAVPATPRTGPPTQPSPRQTTGVQPGRGGRPPAPPNPEVDFPFASAKAKDLPKPERPDRLYRIMSNEEAAATLRTGKLQPGRGGQDPHKYLGLDSRYPALFMQSALQKAEDLAEKAAKAEQAGNAALANRLRAQSKDVIASWEAAQGQTILVEIRLKPGTLEKMLRRSADESRRNAYKGQDIFVYKYERLSHNVAVPDWQIDQFNKLYVESIQLHGWRRPFGPGPALEGGN